MSGGTYRGRCFTVPHDWPSGGVRPNRTPPQVSCGVKRQRLIVEENPQSPAIAFSLTGRRRTLVLIGASLTGAAQRTTVPGGWEISF
jgi:hypothetical protein